MDDSTLPGQREIHQPATINPMRQSHPGGLTPSPLPAKLPSHDLFEPEDEERVPSGDLFLQRRQVTWHKDVETNHASVSVPTLPPRPVTARPIPLTPLSPPHRPFPTSMLFWLSMLVLIMLVLGGVFGIIVTFGSGLRPNQPGNQEMSLQIVPSNLPVGATMTLRGINFSPHGKVGLTRDANIPLLDTGGTSIITADAQGSFTDTVVVGSDWEAGQHLINAEDATQHKIAQFPIFVTGQVQSLRPAHLLISPSLLDMGAGDLTTNSTQILTLTNIGGGQITWDGSAGQPWLQLSPGNGTFASGQHAQITVAIDRSNLATGNYKTSITITSNAGNSTVPVQAQVIPLQPAHEATLQLNTAVLSFTGVDGGHAPATQSVAINNPGVLPLQWQATTSSTWLSFAPQTGTVASGVTQMLSVGVNTSTLLPGTYRGVITISGTGTMPVKGSPQNIYVNVTIVPQCTLQVVPGSLTLTGVYLHDGPSAQKVTLSPSQSCTGSIQWSASSNANWLTISATRGVTPSSPMVGVNVTGLQPGTYHGSIFFSSSTGTQTLPVTLTMGQPATPLLDTTPATMVFNGIIGQANPPVQTFTVVNTAGGTLNWQATKAASVGGAWLSVTPTAGTLAAGQSTTINVAVTTLTSLVPGTYNATITITGTDGEGNQAGGSPQTIAVTFTVQAPCTISAVPATLAFTSVVGQATPPDAQPVTITASGACADALTWTATVSSGATWLSLTPTTGTATLKTPGTASIGVSLTGLKAGTYNGTITMTAVDSVTNAAVGTPQQVPVTLTVQPACTLQAPSVPQLTFTTEAGTNPAAQTFTMSATGACPGKVVITPTVTLNSGTGWLAVTPASLNLSPGHSATLTATVTSTSLAAGTYTASISLAATSSGVAIAGSPQSVEVTLNVGAAAALAIAPGSLTINTTTGTSTTPLTISNAGGSSFNWTAMLAANAPSFISLSVGVEPNLSGGGNQPLNIVVNATGLPGGSTYNTSVTINAIDSATGKPTANSPITIPITVNVAPPAMQLSTMSLSFTTTAGTKPAAQSIVLTNTGGDGLNWTIGTPPATWLTVSPTSGTDASGATSSLAFTVDATNLKAGQYNATVVITPSAGNPTTVTVTLTAS
jgi:hypothetical protein